MASISQRGSLFLCRVRLRGRPAVSRTFTTRAEAAGVHDLHFHDPRHAATSRLFEAGLPIERVALITGRSDWRNLRRYTNLKPESLTVGHSGSLSASTIDASVNSNRSDVR